MFTLPDLPYAFEALEPHIDKQTMELHHDKHHAGYVNNLNDALKDIPELLNMDIKELLVSLDKVPEELRAKVRNNGGGHANHSFFWKIMFTPIQDGAIDITPKGQLLNSISSTFGDFNSFKEKFANAALGRFGSGWVWLTCDKGVLKIEDTPNQDTPLMEGRHAILGLDVWEHAYYLKYQNRRIDYVNNWWHVVNWSKVEEYFSKLNV